MATQPEVPHTSGSISKFSTSPIEIVYTKSIHLNFSETPWNFAIKFQHENFTTLSSRMQIRIMEQSDCLNVS